MFTQITPQMDGKADIHTHTKYSGMSKLRFMRFPDAVSDPVEVVRTAEKRGLDVEVVRLSKLGTDLDGTRKIIQKVVAWYKVKAKLDAIEGRK